MKSKKTEEEGNRLIGLVCNILHCMMSIHYVFNFNLREPILNSGSVKS